MNKKMKNLILVVLIAVAGFASATPANALVTDPTIFTQLQQRRWELIVKETDLLKEKQSLENKIDDLNRRNENRQFELRLNQLSRDLDKTHMDLSKVRLDIRDIDRALSS